MKSTVFRRLLRLYPQDVRLMYEQEMLEELEHDGWKAVPWLVIDSLAERAATLYSHHSFRGRRAPNPGQVRPPNMSKKEWYGTS